MSSGERGYIDHNRDGQIRDVDGNLLSPERINTSSIVALPGIKETSSSGLHWRVLLYVPNLMGYLRIFLAFQGYQAAMQNQHSNALNMWIAAAILDLFDGIVARRLNQCSQFGALLDVIADNILRSIVWISIIMEVAEHDDTSHGKRCIWTAILFLEWITMLCSQCKSQDKHWKDMTQKEHPFWVQAVFRNNFRTVPGILTIYGLFIAPLGTYVMYADEIWPKELLSDRYISYLLSASYVGRMMAASVELWICFDYTCHVINSDNTQDNKSKITW